MLLPLLCTSLKMSVQIATILETLCTEVHDLSSLVANLDFATQPPNHAPLQASLRDFASHLLSAAQAPFLPQRFNEAPPPPSYPSAFRPSPACNINPPHEGQGKGRAPPTLPPPPPPPPNTVWLSPSADRTFKDITHPPLPPLPTATPKCLPKNTPTLGKPMSSIKGNTLRALHGSPVTWTPLGAPSLPWPSRPPIHMPKLLRLLPRLKKAPKQCPLPRLPQLRLCWERSL